ncbi:MAG: futalosine hydrolase [Sphingobacteriales bacterium]|nr:MAG: futalosine hydrolase [Sphingobacteriales bacterium]
MKLLLVAATTAEIAPTLEVLSGTAAPVSVCITGVGVCAATFALTRALLSDTYDAVILAGIAGSFDRSLVLGTVVQVTGDRFGDLGVEDNGQFIDLVQLGFATADKLVPETIVPDMALPDLPKRNAITVHTATGTTATAAHRLHTYGPVLETMEGAAIHYVCRQLQMPLLHLRAVSNYAEARNRPAWNIGGALKNLNEVLKELLLSRKAD